jgi:hypothetical protein
MNEPFADHPELGSGQYTKKIYHIASKLPGWLRSVLPTKATELHEEAWNAFAPFPELLLFPLFALCSHNCSDTHIVVQF